MINIILVIFLCLLPLSSNAQSLVVKGLFDNAALIIVDGENVFIKAGQTKKNIKLLKANSREALIEINGKQQSLTLSQQVGGQYQAVETKRVRIASQTGGHHWVRGQVNGRNVDFVVDTGASVIAMNLSTAQRLGIDYQNGQAGYVSTANGVIETRMVNLAQVTVGEITLNNVAASITLNNALSVTLLGNSFLSRTQMRTDNGVLILEYKQ